MGTTIGPSSAWSWIPGSRYARPGKTAAEKGRIANDRQPSRLDDGAPLRHVPPSDRRHPRATSMGSPQQMKLVRYGAEGREKPGLVDADGRVRDISAIVDDIDGYALSPKMLARIARAKVASLPLVPGKPRLGSCVAWPVNFIGIGSELHGPRGRDRHGPAEGAGDLPEGLELRLRRERPDHPAEGGREARLGGRGWHRHRHTRPLRQRARRDGPCRGLLPCQRPLRARRSARPRRHLDQGQERTRRSARSGRGW